MSRSRISLYFPRKPDIVVDAFFPAYRLYLESGRVYQQKRPGDRWVRKKDMRPRRPQCQAGDTK